MNNRRNFLGAAAAAAAGLAVGALTAPRARADEPRSPDSLPTNSNDRGGKFRPRSRFGLGGVAAGNGFYPATPEELLGAVEAAWLEGARYFDTSPWYGLGLSERRLGVFLQDKPRDEFVLSTKVGRILEPKPELGERDVSIWKNAPSFDYHYDSSADATRQSIEDSLQRLGLAQLDIVFIHDLSPDNPDFGDEWEKHFEIARQGAMPELTRMRDEGLIKAWGMGVNTIEPATRAIEVADPDIILLATQYSIVKHDDALKRFFPVARDAGVSMVVGAPLMAGFLAGRHRYLYGPDVPQGMFEKRARISRIAEEHDTDLLTASLQFCNAPDIVSAVIPGARSARQVRQNAEAMRAEIAADFSQALKREKLIADDAPVPS